MSVPILTRQPEGVCVVCKGQLGPTHEHVYIDTAQLKLMNDLIDMTVDAGCLIVTQDYKFYGAHPRLAAGFMWYPVPITHVGPHGTCTASMPHHHCEISDLIYERDGDNEVPNTPDDTVGASGEGKNEEGGGTD